MIKSIINTFVKKVLLQRVKDIEFYMRNGAEVQHNLLKSLIHKAQHTEYGTKYNFSSINTYDQYRDRLPIRTYEEYYPFIERTLRGEKNILWSGTVKWFAKSSGTTNDKSKFIPITKDNLETCHYAAGRDMLALYLDQYPDTRIFTGKCLTIGGSHEISRFNQSAKYGDLSAVLIENLPWIYQFQRAPSKTVALMGNYESKLIKMKEETINQNITCMAGVPTWTVILLQSLMKEKNALFISDIWKNLEVFFHGGVSFVPYRDQFRSFCPSLRFMETYNASEGFFGLQNDLNTLDLLLLLNRGIFYEFVALDELEREHPKAVSIDEVEIGQTYALIISTNSGLWRYNIGDTVRFTSKYPFKIQIVGRTKLFINAFGEELMIENAEQAILHASSVTGAIVRDYTAAPIYFHGTKHGGHEWLIEFESPPHDLVLFVESLDSKLKEVNSDYEAKRYKDMALGKPLVRILPDGTFYEWMKRRGKLGGQNKVPRLSNDRTYVDSILKMIAG
jgi:hypothetical protein